MSDPKRTRSAGGHSTRVPPARVPTPSPHAPRRRVGVPGGSGFRLDRNRIATVATWAALSVTLVFRRTGFRRRGRGSRGCGIDEPGLGLPRRYHPAAERRARDPGRTCKAGVHRAARVPPQTVSDDGRRNGPAGSTPPARRAAVRRPPLGLRRVVAATSTRRRVRGARSRRRSRLNAPPPPATSRPRR